MKRSFLTWILICAVVVASLGLLGGAADAQNKTEIQFWHAMEGQLGEVVGELVNKFNQSQEEFEVKAMYKGTYMQVLQASLTAYRQKKDPPHIVQLAEVSTQRMLLSDAIFPVYRLMRRQKIVNLDDLDFIEAIADYYSKDGKLYSMPFNVTTPILYYNKAIFRKAGLGDTPPVTWQEVEDASRKIIATGAAKCGFTTPMPSWTLIENAFFWHDQPFATNQNGFTGLDTRLLINSDFGLMHVGALARWRKENIFSPADDGKMDQFINGDCAMLLQTSAFIGDFKKSLTFDWGTGQLPHWGAPYPKANTSVGGGSLWVLRGHKPAEYEGAAQFLKFLLEPAQRKWALNATGWLPIRKSVFMSFDEDSFYEENPEKWTGVSQVMNAKPTPNSRGLRLGNFLAVREVIEFELENIFSGKKTVKQGLDDAVYKGNAILKQFRVNHSAAAQGEI